MLSIDQIVAQIPFCLSGTNFADLGKSYFGKVRDNYSKDGKRLIVVTDRLSAFDRIITEIPFKGQVLNQISKFWFENTADIVRNHVIEYPDPNAVLAKECRPLPVEMVVRGYITGVTSTSIWCNYEKGVRDFCGNVLPEGLRKNEKLAQPIITPSTKAEKGGHDESVSGQYLIEKGIVSAELFEKLSDISMKLYLRGVEIAAKQGIILVDTKYEFGLDENDEIVLIDEIHTPDSSRFWFINEYEARLASGEEQKKIDKEYLREWLADKGFRGDGEIPVIPDEIRAETARRYIEAFELITGETFEAQVGQVLPRLEQNLSKYF